ncbi:MAG: hypothetical protein RL134_1446 [Actinomycetota bacterium]|jgi:hypothetical protein
MKTPNPRLRPLFNNSKSTARVELFIPAGAEISVDDDVAAQLPAAFAPVAEDAVVVNIDPTPMPTEELVAEAVKAVKKAAPRKPPKGE